MCSKLQGTYFGLEIKNQKRRRNEVRLAVTEREIIPVIINQLKVTATLTTLQPISITTLTTLQAISFTHSYGWCLTVLWFLNFLWICFHLL